ncbi:MAG: STAS domain-containing protein [Acidimicrobiales bacterium]
MERGSAPRAAVVVVDVPLSFRGIDRLCAGARHLLVTGKVDLITYDVRAIAEPDLLAVHALARLQLTARQTGGAIRVRHASTSLRGLLDLVGLHEIVPLCDNDESPLVSGGQIEQDEQAGVQERVDRGDPPG